MATTVFLIGELLGPGAESSALPLPSLPGFTGYDAVQNRFSGQIGVNFETLEAMGHYRSWPAPVTDRPSTDLNLNLSAKMKQYGSRNNIFIDFCKRMQLSRERHLSY